MLATVKQAPADTVPEAGPAAPVADVVKPIKGVTFTGTVAVTVTGTVAVASE